MADSIFIPGPDQTIVPTEHARGPWDPRALHGGAPAALIATAFQESAARDGGDGGTNEDRGTGTDGGGSAGDRMVVARMSFELLRPIPLAPLRLQTTVTRPGRRVQSLRAELRTADGALVCEATATRIAAVPAGLPVPPTAIAPGGDGTLAAPEQGRAIRFALDESPDRHDFATMMEMRLIGGGPLEGLGGPARPGDGDDDDGDPSDRRTRMWMRPRHPLFPGQPMSALARVAATADFGNGISAILPFGDYLFINADLSITLAREPVGEWIALDAATHLPAGGVGLAESIVHDRHGPVGRASQALVVRPR